MTIDLKSDRQTVKWVSPMRVDLLPGRWGSQIIANRCSMSDLPSHGAIPWSIFSGKWALFRDDVINVRDDGKSVM